LEKVTDYERVRQAETGKQETKASSEEGCRAAEQVERCIDGRGNPEGQKEEDEKQGMNER
jgi:hypothetical protein